MEVRILGNEKKPKSSPKDYGRWDRTPIKVIKKPKKSVKKGK